MMILPQYVVIFCWAVFLFYWLANWKNVKPTKDYKMSFIYLRGLGFAIIALVLITHFVFQNVLKVPLCQWDAAGCHYHPFGAATQSVWLQVVAMLFTLVGLVIAIIARKTLAGNWSSTLDLKKGHELVTTGIYHHMRYPIYTGMLLMLVGTVLLFPSFIELLIFCFVFAVTLYRIKKEEELMTKTFPKEYPEYKKHVKALIPFAW